MYTFQHAMLLVNDNSGAERTEHRLTDVVPSLSNMAKRLTIARPENEEESQALCRQAGKYDLFVIMGGDGTVHHCIDVIAQLDERPLLAVLPGGTSNDFSRTIGMPQDLEEAAESLTGGKIVETDVGRAGSRHFINFWGIGLAAATSKNVDSGTKRNFGPLSYMTSTLRTLKEAESFPFEIVADGERLIGEAIAIFVLNGSSLATTPIPIAGITPFDGELDLLIFRNTNLATLRELMSLRNEDTDNADLDTIEYVRVKQLKIQAAGQQLADMDGELYEELTGEIQVLPGHLRLLVPETDMAEE
ncbi:MULTISPECIES: diacylglycerol/lipid kinase family protein [Sporosarcina]|uniref:diacylglycerol/lipid kinase family protein n=1 Tax=Sporosarcina TaxID=1569 RepID=UPI00058E85A2|nr:MULTISPECIES: diacylglycerol kinase family protein [Sporosarcina]WJY26230.1 diacylglycerol kinase family lipid kinase [Sporosarcina sp. 0.2-SM1T-5]